MGVKCMQERKIYEAPDVELVQFTSEENIMEGSGIELPEHEWD